MNKTIRMLELIAMKTSLDTSECIQEVKEINSKAQLYDNAKEDLELVSAIRWYQSIQPLYFPEEQTILSKYREQKESGSRD